MVILENISILTKYRNVRALTNSLCQPFQTEDYVIQSMPDVSPAKWHLAHTTWFFENFILKQSPSYKAFHPQYDYLFNSYYNSVGVRHCRAKRGQLSRPTVEEIYQYRSYVDSHIENLYSNLDEYDKLYPLLELGMHHEEQHQELLLTDIKHVFACNPLHPVYMQQKPRKPEAPVPDLKWIIVDEGLYPIGHTGIGFGYDNEFPRHQVFLKSYKVANRLITNGEYLKFINDQGYQRPEFWLSDGWDMAQSNEWVAPLYWENVDGQWFNMTLNGFLPVDQAAPVCHISYFEADAYARWQDKRLLTEAEWEIIALRQPVIGNFVEDQFFRPVAMDADSTIQEVYQLFGDVWEWTASPYVGYPGYKPAKDALGEYNGKFMNNQMVLRGGSCATSKKHVRPTYRNFFAPGARWQFSGIRLGDDA